MMDVDKIKFTSSASRSMDQLKPFVETKGHNVANSIHVFYLCFTNANSAFLEFIQSRGIELEVKKIETLLNRFASKNPDQFIGTTAPYRICESINSLIRKSFKIANKYEHSYVGTEHLIYSFLEENHNFCELLLKNDIDTEHLKLSALAFISGEDGSFAFDPDFYDDEDDDDDEEDDPSTSYLEKYCSLFNQTANTESFPRISGRDKEISLIEEVLCRKTKSNCILIGEAGTGKTSIVEGLAQLIEQKDYAGPLADKKIFSLDLGSLVAGTKYRGQFEERFSKLLTELKNRKDGILFIDEIHTIIGTGSREGSQDLANMLKPALARGEIMCIGATTSTEYKKYFEKDAALARRFHVVNVDEPELEYVLKMLKTSLPSYEQHHNVLFSSKIANVAAKMCQVYLPNQRFPDKLFDVIDQAASKARIRSSGSEVKVTIDDVCEVIADKINVDVKTIKESQNKTFAEFEENINKNIFGQESNISKIYDILACAKAGFQNKNKPISSFFFVGPTSVGKTFAAKQIAKEFYGNEKSFLQLNMSEYQEQASISKLIGASAGYVGYEDGGLLTEFVRKNPNSLILFDEAEKCNPNVLNLLLQILDEAKINDNLNRSVDFSRCIIVLTSNIGADTSSQKQMGFVAEQTTEQENYEISVKKMLPPELISRIDDVVVFKNLDKQSVVKIFDAKLSEVLENLNQKGISVNFEFTGEDLFDLNQNAEEHARQVKKIVRQKLEVPLSKFIINNPKKKNISAKMLDGKLSVC
jgi:ATP-dependent Clp protease ATP-binding subunit ClpA